MGRKSAKPGTIAAFAEAGGAYVVCRRCGHYAALDAPRLVGRFGWADDMNDVMPYFRCKRCKAKDCFLNQGPPR